MYWFASFLLVGIPGAQHKGTFIAHNLVLHAHTQNVWQVWEPGGASGTGLQHGHMKRQLGLGL